MCRVRSCCKQFRWLPLSGHAHHDGEAHGLVPLLAEVLERAVEDDVPVAAVAGQCRPSCDRHLCGTSGAVPLSATPSDSRCQLTVGCHAHPRPTHLNQPTRAAPSRVASLAGDALTSSSTRAEFMIWARKARMAYERSCMGAGRQLSWWDPVPSCGLRQHGSLSQLAQATEQLSKWGLMSSCNCVTVQRRDMWAGRAGSCCWCCWCMCARRSRTPVCIAMRLAAWCCARGSPGR